MNKLTPATIFLMLAACAAYKVVHEGKITQAESNSDVVSVIKEN